MVVSHSVARERKQKGWRGLQWETTWPLLPTRNTSNAHRLQSNLALPPPLALAQTRALFSVAGTSHPQEWVGGWGRRVHYDDDNNSDALYFGRSVFSPKTATFSSPDIPRWFEPSWHCPLCPFVRIYKRCWSSVHQIFVQNNNAAHLGSQSSEKKKKQPNMRLCGRRYFHAENIMFIDLWLQFVTWPNFMRSLHIDPDSRYFSILGRPLTQFHAPHYVLRRSHTSQTTWPLCIVDVEQVRVVRSSTHLGLTWMSKRTSGTRKLRSPNAKTAAVSILNHASLLLSIPTV